MLSTLKQLAEQIQRDMPALSPDHLRSLRAQLEALGPAADPKQKRELLFETAEAAFRLGDFQAAIDHHLRAYELLSSTRRDTREANRIMFRLGVAYLRLGEAENCWVRRNAQNCLLPIQGDGVHLRKQSSRNAIRYFLEALRNPSDDATMLLTIRWLLNIAYMTVGGYPDEIPKEHLVPPWAFASQVQIPRFTNVAPKLGIDTFSWCGGAIVDDFDNDDYLDIITSTSDVSGQMRLYRNNRDGTFSERTHQAGLTGLVGGLNMVQADYDNDGDTFTCGGNPTWTGVNITFRYDTEPEIFAIVAVGAIAITFEFLIPCCFTCNLIGLQSRLSSLNKGIFTHLSSSSISIVSTGNIPLSHLEPE